MRCESTGYHDYSFLLDIQGNNHIIMGVGIFEQFDFVTMKNHLLNRALNIDKCKSNLVKKFGTYWF